MSDNGSARLRRSNQPKLRLNGAQTENERSTSSGLRGRLRGLFNRLTQPKTLEWIGLGVTFVGVGLGLTLMATATPVVGAAVGGGLVLLGLASYARGAYKARQERLQSELWMGISNLNYQRLDNEDELYQSH